MRLISTAFIVRSYQRQTFTLCWLKSCVHSYTELRKNSFCFLKQFLVYILCAICLGNAKLSLLFWDHAVLLF